MASVLLPVQTFATLALVGLIWTIQIVHYPLFRRVGEDAYPAYQAGHVRRISIVVAPLMLAELATAVLLVLVPTDVPPALAWIGLALVGVIWISTALLQAPLHARLEQGFDARTHRRLVATNWIRTLAWTARGAIVLAMWGC